MFLWLNLVSYQSISDESVDLGSADSKPNDQSTQKSAQKPAVSWWKDDNRSSRGAGRGNIEKLLCYVTYFTLDIY